MADYVSSFTGAEIDAAITKVRTLTDADTINEGVDAATEMTDYIVGQGTSGDWTWRKWKSGIAECWGKFNTGTMTMTADVNLYLSAEMTEAFPTGLFSAAPIALINVHAAGGLVSAKATNSITASALKYQVFRTNSSTNATWVVCHAIGRWTT